MLRTSLGLLKVPPSVPGGAALVRRSGHERPILSAPLPGERARTRLLVGLLVSKTGLLAGSETGMIRGAQLACDEINAAGGVLGKRIGLRVEDDGTAPRPAAAAFRRALADPSVVAILGPTSSSAAFPLRAEAQRENVAMVLLSATGYVSEDDAHSCCFRIAAPEAALGAPNKCPLAAAVVSLAGGGRAEPRARLVALDNVDGDGFRMALRNFDLASPLKVHDEPAFYDEPEGVLAEQDALAGAAAKVLEDGSASGRHSSPSSTARAQRCGSCRSSRTSMPSRRAWLSMPGATSTCSGWSAARLRSGHTA